MPLPQLEKTWEFDVNQLYTAEATPLATHQKVLYGIKDALVGVLGARAAVQSRWTVKRSCDGSAIADSTGDLWDDATKLLWGAGAHSWIVLEQQGVGSTFQVCIDLNNADPSLLTIVWAPDGFPESGTGSGDTSNRPVGVTEVVLLDNAQWLGGQSTIQFRIHAMQSTDGECTRVIGYWQTHPVLLWVFDRATRTVAGWSSPGVALATGTLDGNVTFDALHSIATPNLRGFGTAPMRLWMSTESFGSGVAAVGSKLVGTNAFDLNWPLTPIGLASLDPGQVGRHGELSDLWFGSAGANHGDTYPGDTSRQFVQFGHLVFPWDGTPSVDGSVPEIA